MPFDTIYPEQKYSSTPNENTGAKNKILKTHLKHTKFS